MFKELYLNYIDEIKSSSDGWHSVKCPFHNDSHPSAGFNEHSGVFNCQDAECIGALSPRAFVAKYLSIPYQEADTIVSQYTEEHFSLTEKKTSADTAKNPTFNPKFQGIVEASLRNIREDIPMVQDFLLSRNLVYSTLVTKRIGFLPANENPWKTDLLVFPYFVEDKIIAIRYRDAIGAKHAEKGSYFTLWGLETLTDEDTTVVLTEGETDGCKALEYLPTFKVLSLPGSAIKKEIVRDLATLECILYIHDSDEAGVASAKKLSELLGDKLIPIALPWKRSQLGKDLCNWSAYNGPEVLQFLTNQRSSFFMPEILSGKDLLGKALEQVNDSQLVTNLINPGDFVLLSGPPKSRKTWIALSLIRTLLDIDSPFLGLSHLVSEGSSNILFVQEDKFRYKELYERCVQSLTGTDWEDKTTWVLKQGFSLDEQKWVDWIIEQIRKRKTNVLFLDPFQELHSRDEDNAKDTKIIYDNLNYIWKHFPDLVIVLVHHFGKNGDITKTWQALRGSTKLSGAVNTGIFTDKITRNGQEIIRVIIDGRSIEPVTAPDSAETTLECIFDNGLVALQDLNVTCDINVFCAEVKKKVRWNLLDCARHFGVSEKTIRRWCAKIDFPITKSTKGSPATILYEKEGRKP